MIYDLRLKRRTIIIAVFLFGLILFLVSALSYGKKTKVNINKNSSFNKILSKITPTPSPTNAPTPTPTLTPQQLAEIERKRFADLNQKYGPCKYVPILMYHHVMETEAAKKILATNLNVPPDIFRTQIDYLLGKGYQIIGLDDMMSGIAGSFLPAKPVVLTFDDGYRDFYDNVFPILKEKGVKATVFVISQFVGGERYLVWAQVNELASSGLVLIGDHTLNHLSLSSQSREDQTNQIVSAKSVIEANIGRSVSFFAYPYGGSNQNAKEILKENGFLGAVTTIPGRTQCLGLPYDLQRIRIGAASLLRFGL